MKTWLFTWNPSNWTWDDAFYGYNELRSDISQVGCGITKWSCGVNKSICPRDRIFLIKLGVASRGIVASGYAETPVFEGKHWDAKKVKNGKTCRRIYIRFDKILNVDAGECLPYEQLKSINPTFHWSPQASGVLIPTETANDLERLWKACVSE